jgi:hypothetical protein
MAELLKLSTHAGLGTRTGCAKGWKGPSNFQSGKQLHGKGVQTLSPCGFPFGLVTALGK